MTSSIFGSDQPLLARIVSHLKRPMGLSRLLTQSVRCNPGEEWQEGRLTIEDLGMRLNSTKREHLSRNIQLATRRWLQENLAATGTIADPEASNASSEGYAAGKSAAKEYILSCNALTACIDDTQLWDDQIGNAPTPSGYTAGEYVAFRHGLVRGFAEVLSQLFDSATPKREVDPDDPNRSWYDADTATLHLVVESATWKEGIYIYCASRVIGLTTYSREGLETAEDTSQLDDCQRDSLNEAIESVRENLGMRKSHGGISPRKPLRARDAHGKIVAVPSHAKIDVARIITTKALKKK